MVGLAFEGAHLGYPCVTDRAKVWVPGKFWLVHQLEGGGEVAVGKAHWGHTQALSFSFKLWTHVLGPMSQHPWELPGDLISFQARLRMYFLFQSRSGSLGVLSWNLGSVGKGVARGAMNTLLPTSPRLSVRELLLGGLRIASRGCERCSWVDGRLSKHWKMHVILIATGVMRAFHLVWYHTGQWMHTSPCQLSTVSRVLGN